MLSCAPFLAVAVAAAEVAVVAMAMPASMVRVGCYGPQESFTDKDGYVCSSNRPSVKSTGPLLELGDSMMLQTV